MSKSFSPLRANSFSLIELLVVLAIIAILAGISIPAILSLMRSSNLTSAGNLMVGQLDLSRQFAMTKNCQVEVRFYQLPDPNVASSSTPSVYRAFQSFSLDNGGTQTNAITKIVYLPSQIAISSNTNASPLLLTSSPAPRSSPPPYAVAGTTAGTALGPYPPSSYNYVDFHFKSDGSTDLNPAWGVLWHLSLANQNDKTSGTANLPLNYYTVQVDARTGRVRTYRPN